VDFEWDPAKEATNSAKHGVHFVDAVTALEDDLALTMRDLDDESEERWITLWHGCIRQTLGRGLHLA
jgi:uncharacterized DUF497 family protein